MSKGKLIKEKFNLFLAELEGLNKGIIINKSIYYDPEDLGEFREQYEKDLINLIELSETEIELILKGEKILIEIL